MKHFLKTTDFSEQEAEAVFSLAQTFKQERGITSLTHLDKAVVGDALF